MGNGIGWVVKWAFPRQDGVFGRFCRLVPMYGYAAWEIALLWETY
jgi:hypothetical protein